MVYPKDYGLPKMNKFPQNTQNISNSFESNAANQNNAFKVNYPNSKNYFKPIIINSSPFKRSNDKLKNDRKSVSREGMFLDHSPTQLVENTEISSSKKHPSGFIPFQYSNAGTVNTIRNNEKRKSDERNTETKSENNNRKLFDVLKIIKDSKIEDNKYKRYSMNNFDDFKKAASLTEDVKKECLQAVVTGEAESSESSSTFQKLNQNLCKGIFCFVLKYFLKSYVLRL